MIGPILGNLKSARQYTKHFMDDMASTAEEVYSDWQARKLKKHLDWSEEGRARVKAGRYRR